MQRREVAQVAAHAQVEVERRLLEHHAQSRQCPARGIGQIETGDAYAALCGHEQMRE
jgi:hypothetical protein